MKKLLALFLFPAVCWAGAVQHNQLTDTNALHALHLAGYAVPNYAGLQAVTNMWCGDLAYEQDNGQEWIYQCPSDPQTPGYGSGTWAPFLISPAAIATDTYTPTPSYTPTFTPTGTWSPNLTLTSTPTYTPTPSYTPTVTTTPELFYQNGGSAVTVAYGLIKGIANTNTPTNTFTPTLAFTPTSTPTPTPTNWGPPPYVPYTGATGSINLNNQSVANISKLTVGSVGTPTGGAVLGANGAGAIGDTYGAASEASSIPIINKSLGSSIDNVYDYILLSYANTSAGTFHNTGFDGQIYLYRGSEVSDNFQTEYDISVINAYSSYRAAKFNLFGYYNDAQLVTLTYSGNSYTAIQIPPHQESDVFITGRYWGFLPILTTATSVSGVTPWLNPDICSNGGSGNVGIDAISPAFPLVVNGTTSSNSYDIQPSQTATPLVMIPVKVNNLSPTPTQITVYVLGHQ